MKPAILIHTNTGVPNPWAAAYYWAAAYSQPDRTRVQLVQVKLCIHACAHWPTTHPGQFPSHPLWRAAKLQKVGTTVLISITIEQK